MPQIAPGVSAGRQTQTPALVVATHDALVWQLETTLHVSVGAVQEARQTPETQ